MLSGGGWFGTLNKGSSGVIEIVVDCSPHSVRM